MSSNNGKQPLVPSAREAMNKFKMEAASDLDVSFSYKIDPNIREFKFLILSIPETQVPHQALR